MSFFDVLFGKPLATSNEHNEHIGVATGIPIFGLDGLTSAAYGPEAAMTLLIPLGLWGVSHYLLRHPGASRHPLFQLSADHRGVPQRGRVFHRGEREPRRPGRSARSRGAD